MNNIYCKMTVRHYNLKNGAKTVWVEETERAIIDRGIDQTCYRNIVEVAPFFRRLGGSETLNRAYTRSGYLVYEIISKSPDRTQKTVRTFNFDI